jgi:hypothetical protein
MELSLNPYSVSIAESSPDQKHTALRRISAALLAFTFSALLAFTLGLGLNEGIAYTANQLVALPKWDLLFVYSVYALIAAAIGTICAYPSRSILARCIGGLALGLGTQIDGLFELFPSTLSRPIFAFITQYDPWIQGFFAIALSIASEWLFYKWRFRKQQLDSRIFPESTNSIDSRVGNEMRRTIDSTDVAATASKQRCQEQTKEQTKVSGIID